MYIMIVVNNRAAIISVALSRIRRAMRMEIEQLSLFLTRNELGILNHDVYCLDLI